MTTVKVWRAADYVRMPWKNGGGSTEEITRDAGHGLDGFGWRLSIADIAESGGFSTFAGYQRVITVIQGAGMVLTVEPGLYFAIDDDKVPQHLRGIGIRIEDDVLVTDGDPDVLTAACVKEIVDVEAMVGQGGNWVRRVGPGAG